MSVYVGERNVTKLLIEYFAGKKDVNPDGRISGPKETRDYLQALRALRGQAIKDNPKDRTAILKRFENYEKLITKGCGEMDSANPVLQGMYEELTQFIESSAFDKLPKTQKITVALQAEMFSILSKTGKHRGAAFDGKATGTGAEAPKFNPPSENFKAHPKVLANVLPAIDRIDLDQCAEKLGDAKAADNEDLNIYGKTEENPTPLPTEAFWEKGKKIDVNTDLRIKPSKPAANSQIRRLGGVVL